MFSFIKKLFGKNNTGYSSNLMDQAMNSAMENDAGRTSLFFTEESSEKNDNVITRKKAQMAFDVIEEFQWRNKLHLLKTLKTDAIRKFGLSGSPDEKINGTYLRAIHSDKLNLMFLSNDNKGARIIVRNVGILVIEL